MGLEWGELVTKWAAIYSKSQDIYPLALVANRQGLARTVLNYFTTYFLMYLLIYLLAYFLTYLLTYLLLGETGPLLKRDQGRKAISAVVH